jgi:hypothetical protein
MGKDVELSQCIERHDLDFVFISEPWAQNRSRPPNDAVIHWSPERVDRPKGRVHYGTALPMGERICDIVHGSPCYLW